MTDAPKPRARRRVVVVDNRPLAQSIGARIRAARERAGLTQRELASGRYTGAYISALEKGIAKPSMAALSFLADRLAVPVREFLGDETPARTRLEADIRLASGEWQAALDLYRGLLERPVDRRIRAEILRGTAEALYRLNQPTEALAAASESVKLFEELRREPDAALASYWLASAHHAAENSGEARSILLAILARIRRGVTVSPDLAMRVLAALAMVETLDGEHERALAYLEEARAQTDGLDDRKRATFLFSLSQAHQQSGDVEASVRSGIEALALFHAAEAERERAILENSVALTCLRVGNLEQASAHAAEARELAEKLGDKPFLAHVAETEAQIALARNDIDGAMKRADTAIDLARDASNWHALAAALITRARAHAALNRGNEAAEAYAAAAEVLRTHGARPRLREALSEWADLLTRSGDHQRANELYREALTAHSQ